MPLIWTLTAETLLQGTALTAANTGLNADTAGANNLAAADNQFAIAPNLMGIKLEFGVGGITPTNGMALQKNLAVASQLRHIWRFRGIKFNNINTQMDFVTARAAAANLARWRKLADGRISLMSGDGVTTLATTTTALAANGKYDCQLVFKTGLTTGVSEIQIANEGTTTVLETISLTGQAFTVDDFQGFRFGSNVAPSATTAFGFDAVEFHEQATGFVPLTASVPILVGTVNNTYGLIDLTALDTVDSTTPVTLNIAPSTGVFVTSNPMILAAPPGTYVISSTNASGGVSTPQTFVVSGAASTGVQYLRADVPTNTWK